MRGTLATAAAVAVAFITAPIASATPDDPFGDDWAAIAVSAVGPGGYGGSGTQDGAVQIALDECARGSQGTACHIADVIEYGCVAFAINHQTGQWVGGRGPDENSAIQDVAAKLPVGSLGGVHCSTPLHP